jgi:hypothetical protein
MRSVFTHAVAVIVGVALAASSIALAGRAATQSAPTHADMQRLTAEVHEISVSAKAMNNTTYHGFWTMCREQLANGNNYYFDDTANIAKWCN